MNTTSLRTFASPQKETLLAATPRPWQPMIGCTATTALPLWTRHTNAIVQYVVFMNRLLSLSITFSKLLWHGLTSFYYIFNTTSCLYIHRLMKIGVASTFWLLSITLLSTFGLCEHVFISLRYKPEW